MPEQILMLIGPLKPIAMHAAQMAFEHGTSCNVITPIEALAKAPSPLWDPSTSSLFCTPPGMEDIDGKFMYYAKELPFSGSEVARGIADQDPVTSGAWRGYVIKHSEVVKIAVADK